MNTPFHCHSEEGIASPDNSGTEESQTGSSMLPTPAPKFRQAAEHRSDGDSRFLVQGY